MSPLTLTQQQQHYQAQYKMSPPPSSAPFNTPGHSIYIADPRRFSVLSLGLGYTTRITDHSSSANDSPAGSSLTASASANSSGFSGKNVGTSASSTVATSAPTSSSGHNETGSRNAKPDAGGSRGAQPPLSGSAGTNLNGTAGSSGSGLGNLAARARRISFGKRNSLNAKHAAAAAGTAPAGSTSTGAASDAGTGTGGGVTSKAREAWQDLGRAARGAADKFSSVTSGNEHTFTLPSQHASTSSATILGSADGPSAEVGTGASSIAAGRAIDSRLASAVSACAEFQVKPRSMTYSRDRSLADPEVPLDVSAKGWIGAGPLSGGGGGGGYGGGLFAAGNERVEADSAFGDPPIEFCFDTEPLIVAAASHQNKYSHRRPSTSRSSSSDSEFSSSGGLGTNPSSPLSRSFNIQSHKQQQRQPFDPSRLLLKITPPQKAARGLWRKAGHGAGATREEVEEHELRLSFRLRLDSPSNHTQFLVADSVRKLYEAVCALMSGNAELANSALLSSKVVVEGGGAHSGSGPQDCEFDWSCHPASLLASVLKEGQEGGNMFGDAAGSKVACCVSACARRFHVCGVYADRLAI